MKWRTIDFRPAPPGWRAVIAHETLGLSDHVVAGWVVLEEIDDEYRTLVDVPAEDRERQVMAAGHADDGIVMEIGLLVPAPGNKVIEVLGPGEADMTEAERQDLLAYARGEDAEVAAS